MAEDPKTPATPAAPGNGVDVEAITKAAVAAATQAATAAVTQAVSPLADQVKALQADLGKATAVTPESVAKLVTDQLAASKADQDKSAARQAFITDKLKDVPEAYLAKLGDDPAKFAENEQAIRTQLKADLAKLGVKAPDLGGAAQGSGGDPKKVADAVDTSKLSGIELLSLGVQQTSGNASAPADKAASPTAATK